jgi:hypothetical protein
MCWKLKNIATNMTRSLIYTAQNMSVPAAEFAIWKIIVIVRMYLYLKK